jgi:hypothetical protein
MSSINKLNNVGDQTLVSTYESTRRHIPEEHFSPEDGNSKFLGMLVSA